MKPYVYYNLGLSKCHNGNFKFKRKFKFKTRFKEYYIFEIEEYDEFLFMGKFYLRKHKNLEDKYKKITNKYDAFRILSTCVTIAYEEIYSKNKLASFGFLGESRPEEEDERLKKFGDKKRVNTQRYRVYSLLSAKWFSPKSFLHVRDVENSIYFMLNKANKNIDENLVNERVNEYDLDPN